MLGWSESINTQTNQLDFNHNIFQYTIHPWTNYGRLCTFDKKARTENPNVGCVISWWNTSQRWLKNKLIDWNDTLIKICKWFVFAGCSFDFCPGDVKDSPVENLGQVVFGERIRSSSYEVSDVVTDCCSGFIGPFKFRRCEHSMKIILPDQLLAV